MRIFAVMMVRDEADILRINLLHHLSSGIDRFLVVDNGSRDETPAILESFARGGRVEWRRDDGPYRQTEITTALAREAARQGADWILPIDADEFWFAAAGDLRTILERSAAGALRAQIVNFIQHREQIDATPQALLTMTRRAAVPVGPLETVRDLVERQEVAYVETMYQPKWISRATPDIEIAMGNHGVGGIAGSLDDSDRIVCLHALLRSRSVLEAKVDQGARVAALGLPPVQGWHVQRWKRIAEEGDIEREWRANSYENDSLDVYGETHRVVFDPRLRDAVRPWIDALPLALTRSAAGETVRPKVGLRTPLPFTVVSHVARLIGAGSSVELSGGDTGLASTLAALGCEVTSNPASDRSAPEIVVVIEPEMSELDTWRKRIDSSARLIVITPARHDEVVSRTAGLLEHLGSESFTITRADFLQSSTAAASADLDDGIVVSLFTRDDAGTSTDRQIAGALESSAGRADLRRLAETAGAEHLQYTGILERERREYLEEVSARDATIRDLQNEMHAKVSDMQQTMDAEVEKRDATIRDTQAEMHAKVSDMQQTMDAEVEKRDATIRDTQAEMHATVSDMQQTMDAEVEKRDQSIMRLQQEAEMLTSSLHDAMDQAEELERGLQSIYDSRAWKLLTSYRRLLTRFR